METERTCIIAMCNYVYIMLTKNNRDSLTLMRYRIKFHLNSHMVTNNNVDESKTWGLKTQIHGLRSLFSMMNITQLKGSS